MAGADTSLIRMAEHGVSNRPSLEAAVVRMLVCSTGHIREGTDRKLTENHPDVEPLSFYPIEFGYLIWTGSEGLLKLDDPEWANVPTELRDLMIRAKHANIEWIRLDCDAPPIEGITTYAW